MVRLNGERLFGWLFENGFDPEWMEDESEIVICCPLCQDNRPRLYVTSDSGGWICFHCSEQGGLHRFFVAVCELSADEAFEVSRSLRVRDQDDLRDYFGDDTPKPANPRGTKANVELPEAFHLVDRTTPEPFLTYLQSRHVSLDLARSRGIGFCLTGKYRNRIILPVRNAYDDSLATYVARTILKSCPACENALDGCTCERKFPKVLTPSSADGAHPRSTLYNYPYLSSSERVVVVEGAFDALRLPDEAVALLGSSASSDQLSILSNLARYSEIVVCLDGDKAGYSGAAKLANALAGEMIIARVAVLPYDSDPGSLTLEVLDYYLSIAKRYRI